MPMTAHIAVPGSTIETPARMGGPSTGPFIAMTPA